MDFDDLDDVTGSPPLDRRDDLLEQVVVKPVEVPTAPGRNYGGEAKDKLKILFMHGGGTNERCSQPQARNIFTAAGSFLGKKMADNLQIEYFHGVHPVPREWHRAPQMQETMLAFAPNYWLYYGFEPPIEHGGCNHPKEEWVKIDECMDQLGDFLKENGPYDGLCGFDQGGCVVLQAARLAAAGDSRFAYMFRFLILFTTYLPKAHQKQADFRPPAPLRIPTFVSFSLSDFSRPYATFEDAALFIEEGYREVLLHEDSHTPPKFAEGMKQTAQLKIFLQAMSAGSSWSPGNTRQVLKGLQLPMRHLSAPSPGPLVGELAKRVVFVIHEPNLGRRVREDIEALRTLMPFNFDVVPTADPPGPFEAAVPESQKGTLQKRLELYEAVAKLTAEDFRTAFAAVSAEGQSIEVEIEAAQYAEEHAEIEWGTQRELLPTSATVLDPQDVVTNNAEGEDKWARAEEVAEHLLENIKIFPEDQFAVIGLGHGAVVALQVARALMTHRGKGAMPVGFWAVHAPAILPPEATGDGIGWLVDCPVRYMVGEDSLTGAPWRWELQTLGPFSTRVFKSAEDLPGIVASELCEIFRNADSA
mmetsp:Transcript_95485/g.204902  ORF Transcript_95485/g.204902 Transcript_95485/m.204902 type:complete len:587 (+) Transcript_95485:66-1826(+)